MKDNVKLVTRLDRLGPASLSNAELIACVLHEAPSYDQVDEARAMLCEHKGMTGLIRDNTRLGAVREVAARYLEDELVHGEGLKAPTDAHGLVKARIAHLPYEVFLCIFLDNRHRVLAVKEMFRGTIDGANVHPREVVREAMKHNAAAVIFAHNHPSGVAEPSAADRAITGKLRDALDLVNTRVLDHFVVGPGKPVSMAERGLI